MVHYLFCRKDLSISFNASRHVADDYPRSLASVICKIRHAFYHHEQDYTAFQLRYTRQGQLHTKVRTIAYRILLVVNPIKVPHYIHQDLNLSKIAYIFFAYLTYTSYVSCYLS